MVFKTEFPFTLPRGYIDPDGNILREGIMRLATAADEILPMKNPKVQADPAYLSILLLSRVVTRLGSVDRITPKIIEDLCASDRAYLQDFYQKINEIGTDESRS
ncbi:MAG: hypothetical protein WC342_06755 [Methanoregula sp.]|jgi:phage FluMu protein gp41